SRSPTPRTRSPSSFLFFFFSCSGAHRHLHSFPTRRSSDLALLRGHDLDAALVGELDGVADEVQQHLGEAPRVAVAERQPVRHLRSEEHTSELQSLTNLVCRLLLEKKKIPNTPLPL